PYKVWLVLLGLPASTLSQQRQHGVGGRGVGQDKVPAKRTGYCMNVAITDFANALEPSHDLSHQGVDLGVGRVGSDLFGLCAHGCHSSGDSAPGSLSV